MVRRHSIWCVREDTNGLHVFQSDFRLYQFPSVASRRSPSVCGLAGRRRVNAGTSQGASSHAAEPAQRTASRAAGLGLPLPAALSQAWAPFPLPTGHWATNCHCLTLPLAPSPPLPPPHHTHTEHEYPLCWLMLEVCLLLFSSREDNLNTTAQCYLFDSEENFSP